MRFAPCLQDGLLFSETLHRGYKACFKKGTFLVLDKNCFTPTMIFLLCEKYSDFSFSLNLYIGNVRGMH